MHENNQLHAHSALSRIRNYLGSHSLRYFAGAIAVILAVVTMLLPSAYTVEGPGPTQDVLGSSSGSDVISVSGTETHKDSGKLLLVTVNAAGVPGYPVTNAQALVAWLDPKQTVMPQEVVFPVGQTSEEYAEESSQEMDSSQSSATNAALSSAGMMYALGVIDKLTEADETGGKTIAGTGTIDAKGKVGAIGGIRLKMLGALRDGATWFLAPESNCNEVVGHVPQGLRVVKVSTLDEAYQALVAIGQGHTDGLAGCTAS